MAMTCAVQQPEGQMVSRVRTVAFQGIEALPVDVQVMIAPGKMNIQMSRWINSGRADLRATEFQEIIRKFCRSASIRISVECVNSNPARRHRLVHIAMQLSGY